MGLTSPGNSREGLRGRARGGVRVCSRGRVPARFDTFCVKPSSREVNYLKAYVYFTRCDEAPRHPWGW